MTRRAKRFLAAALGAVFVGVGVAGAGWWAQAGLTEAQRLAQYGLWAEARQALTRYFWLHPRDSKAHLLYAEALVKDDQLPVEWSAPEAIKHLAAVPDEDPRGPEARTQQGRVEFFLLYHPTRAESLFQRAIELDPDRPEPYYLLWKLKDQTGRSYLAEPEFWKVYEASARPVRGLRLREWYMSQFYPETANWVLDRLMGITAPKKPADADQTEAYRFIRFRDAEPDSPLGYAALARWFHIQRDTPFALEFLDRSAEKIPNAQEDPFYLATLTSILIDLGKFDRAEECFRKWPEPRAGYEYWLTEGRLLHRARGQYAEAVRAYDRALSVWPGQVDWRTRNRKANCLARLKDVAGAAREHEKAKMLENLMDEVNHRELRRALAHLDDPKELSKLVDFYKKIDRPREAAAWSDHIAWLQSLRAGRSGGEATAR